MKRIIIPLFVFLIFAVSTASADLSWDYSAFAPPDGFSVNNGTSIEFSIALFDNTSFINGTECITVNTDTGLGGCQYIFGTNYAPFGVFFNLTNFPYATGTYNWRANFTSNESVVIYSNTRSYNIILTTATIIPVYPINNQNVTGDFTNYAVNITVDLYLPQDIFSNKYLYFYGYSSYLNSPYLPSETLLCEVVVTANQTYPVRAGTHRYNCLNYMYDKFTNNYNYEELPQYNPKYWRVKGRFIEGQIDGANLFGDTGYQQYNYRLQTKFASIYPPDDAVFCDSTLYIFNATWVNLNPLCGTTSWHNQAISFYAYMNNTCGNVNATWGYYNYANTSQFGELTAPPFDISNNTITYVNANFIVGTTLTNTTYLGFPLVPLTAIRLIYNWTLVCQNGSVYTTPNNDFWYIIGIGGNIPSNVTAYPTYPLPINMSYLMPVLSTYWTSAFNTTTQGGLMFIAFLFLFMMAILVLINMEMFAGIAVFIYGLLVFVRLGYVDVAFMWVMLLISGLLIVYAVRRFLLRRN